MNDTQVTPSRAVLHAHLARAFRNVDSPDMDELRAFTAHLVDRAQDADVLSDLLAEILASAVKGRAAGYSVNPQNDIVDHVMSAYDSALSDNYRH